MRFLLIFFFLSNLAFSQDDFIDQTYFQAKRLYKAGQKDSANLVFTFLLNEPSIEAATKAQIALSIGGFYRAVGDSLATLTYLSEAERFATLSEGAILLNDIKNERGLLYYDKGYYVQALHEFSKVLNGSYQLKDTLGIAIVCINIGNVFKDTEDFEAAIEYYQKAIDHCYHEWGHKFKAMALINIGGALINQEKPAEALTVLTGAQPLVESYSDSLNLAHLQVNIGICNVKLERYEQAKSAFESSLAIYEVLADEEGIFLSYVNLYLVARRLRMIEQKDMYQVLALNPKYENCSRIVQRDLLENLHDDYLEQGDTVSAYVYGSQLKELNEKLMIEAHDEELNRLKSEVNFVQVKNELVKVESHLQKEQEEKAAIHLLNQQLKHQNNWIRALSISGAVLFIGFLLFLVRSNRRKKKLNARLLEQKEEVEAKSEEILNSMDYANSMEKLLLQQMNPHFLYNALMTVDASITTGDTDFAKEYLNLFSDLLRKTLDNSRKDAISLAQEITFLEAYIKLNAIKQGEQFECQFIYDVEDVEDFVFTPPMLVQPFIENALVHGLYHKVDGIKQLIIQIQPNKNHILWTITDNGVGRIKSKEIGKTHKGISHGIKITVDRIYWMKKRYANDFSVEYVDLETGTQVILKTPILDEIQV